MKWGAMGLFMIALGGLVVNTAVHLADTFQPVENAPAPVDVPVTDPFTLQVAAYVKESDARRYVAQLKGQGLDAYWTRASGSSKNLVPGACFPFYNQGRGQGRGRRSEKAAAHR
jgi:hypothetical protein